jgi:hypothetical protein
MKVSSTKRVAGNLPARWCDRLLVSALTVLPPPFAVTGHAILSGHAGLSLLAAINEGGFSTVGTIQGSRRFLCMSTVAQVTRFSDYTL